jgi:hypothetical protein
MGEPSQIGQVPSSVTPGHTGSVIDAAPTTNSAPSKVKPGNWAAPNYSDLDKAVRKDLDALVRASSRFATDLYRAPANGDVQTANAKEIADARNKLHKDVAALIAAAPPKGMTLTDTAAETVGQLIIENYSCVYYEYPVTFITDAVKSALAQRTSKK